MSYRRIGMEFTLHSSAFSVPVEMLLEYKLPVAALKAASLVRFWIITVRGKT